MAESDRAGRGGRVAATISAPTSRRQRRSRRRDAAAAAAAVEIYSNPQQFRVRRGTINYLTPPRDRLHSFVFFFFLFFYYFFFIPYGKNGFMKVALDLSGRYGLI